MDIFLLYLFTRVDELINVAEIAIFIVFFATFISLPVIPLMKDELSAEGLEKLPVWIKSARRWATWIFALSLTIILFVPSKTDLAIIVGGHLAYEGVTSEEFSETSSKLYELIQQELDHAIADGKEKAEELNND